jgi:hypothetical protein
MILMVAGWFSPIRAKGNALGVLTNRQIFTESVTLNTALQTGQEYDIPNKGDLAGLTIEIDASAIGTLTGANNLCGMLNMISIRDAQGKQIFNNISGSDLPQLEFWTGRKGNFTASNTIGNSSATDVYAIQVGVSAANLPAKLQVTYNPYSTAATSGATGGSVTVTVTPFYRPNTSATSQRIWKISTAVASGLNNIQPFLPRGANLLKVAFAYTEADFGYVLFSRDGSEELKVTLQQATAYERELFNSGHQSGLLFLDNTPAVVSDTTILNWDATSADTVALYQFLQD